MAISTAKRIRQLVGVGSYPEQAADLLRKAASFVEDRAALDGGNLTAAEEHIQLAEILIQDIRSEVEQYLAP